MKQQEVFKKIGVIIQEINEQYEYLQGTVDSLNDLELELFVANTHFLKDHAEILRKLNAIKSQPVNKSTIKDEPKWFEPMVQPAKPAGAPFKADPPKSISNDSIKFEIVQPEPELQFETPEPEVEEPEPAIDLTENTPEETFSFEREEPETIRHELVLGEADNYDDEEEGQSQDEGLLTPVAEIESEEESVEPEFESPELEVESPEPKEESKEPEFEPEVTEVEPEPVVEEEPVAEDAPAVEEVTEPIAEMPEPEPEPEIEEEELPFPEPTLFDEPQKKGRKALAESMEDIQLDSLKPKEVQPVLTLNQRLSAQKKEVKSTVATAPPAVIEPLSDIKTAITLNDKLLFVKDLFKGYNLAYTEAIEIVNRFSNFEEADRFLKNNYVTKNNWEGKKETSEKFYALLRRRYA